MTETAKSRGLNRREFLKHSALASGYGMASSLVVAEPTFVVTLIAESGDAVASAPPALWAAGELQKSLSRKGFVVQQASSLEASKRGQFCILASGGSSATARKLLANANLSLPPVPEALTLVRCRFAGRPMLLVCGSDVRGLVYALLELADRIDCSSSPISVFNLPENVIERPANAIRAISRSFESDVEDKPWFNDREFWLPYLSMLAAQRFNRFSLAFGLGYDFTRHITDCYFHFAYPFLVSVPGYNVRADGLPDAERDHNLEMLRFISDQTAARGLDFQLGLWTHAYQWSDSPNANYTISGLTSETHATYCRDALKALLKACPAISSVAFRVHGESGVAEGSYDFWRTVFQGVVNSGRQIEINLHAKGIDQRLLDVALATGMPVTVSPKYWAEHMGLPYQQASIRELEKPRAGKNADGFFELSSGSRSFMRYGYGDLLRKDRRYGVYARVWPGTQRVLLWGDPLFAAATARTSSFCGEQGADLFEPLSFKGRRGSGVRGGRCAYADATLAPRYDWQKFFYTYRVWGRCMYNPDANPDVWLRWLRKQFGFAASAIEQALAHATRILPLVTTAHGPSAANNNYWPEMYTSMPIVENGEPTIYNDTPSPKVFGNASSFDPEIFCNANDFVREIFRQQRSGRISPIDVAQWLEDLADSAVRYLAQADAKAGYRQSPDFRRLATDVAIQSGLGRFFAAKFRAAVLYAIFEQSGDGNALEQSIMVYQRGRKAWLDLAQIASGVYATDITYGPEKHLRGHWRDRLAGIDPDIAALETQKRSSTGGPQPELARQTTREALGRPIRPAIPWHHRPVPGFRAGTPVLIELQMDTTTALPSPLSALLHYRNLNQAEEYLVREMEERGGVYRLEIPGAYTQSPYSLQYFFEIHHGPNHAWLLPGFDPNRPAQPYFLVKQD